MHTNVNGGQKLDWLTRMFLREIVDYYSLQFEEEETRNPSNANKYWKETSIMSKIRNTVFNYEQYNTNAHTILSSSVKCKNERP